MTRHVGGRAGRLGFSRTMALRSLRDRVASLVQHEVPVLPFRRRSAFPAPHADVEELEELSEADFDTVFQTGSLYIGKAEATLREIVEALERTYCRAVGAEFMHIVSTEERHWIQRRMDGVRSAPEYDAGFVRHLWLRP